MIAAVVLSAGASSRYGNQKLLLPLAGKSVARWAVEGVLASRVEDVVVVLGREAEAVRRALEGLPVRFVLNPEFRKGMSTSLRAGIGALHPDAEAVLIALGDQPRVPPGVVDRLIAAFRNSGKPIIAPVYNGERGNPVLFAASVFPELRRIAGDQGARAILARDPQRISAVPFPFPPPRDVDTPDDFRALVAPIECSDRSRIDPG